MIKSSDDIGFTHTDDFEIDFTYNRRKWVKLALAGATFAALPFFTKCSEDDQFSEIDMNGKGVFSESQMRVLTSLIETIAPDDGNGPSGLQMNAHQYFLWLLTIEHYTDKDFMMVQFDEFNKACKNDYQTTFDKLEVIEKEHFFSKVQENKLLRTFLSWLTTVTFEAYFLDPIYGVNVNQAGWKWINHFVGMPRPSEENRYPKLLANLEP